MSRTGKWVDEVEEWDGASASGESELVDEVSEIKISDTESVSSAGAGTSRANVSGADIGSDTGKCTPEPGKTSELSFGGRYSNQNELGQKLGETKVFTKKTKSTIFVYPSTKLQSLSPTLPWSEVMLNIPRMVKKTHVVSWKNFFVQNLPQQIAAEEMRTKIGRLIKERVSSGWESYIPEQEDIKPGTFCLAPNDSGCYVRAEILETRAKSAQVRVFFVDYGNSTILSNQQLQKIPESYLKVPRQVSQFRWDVAVGREMSEERGGMFFDQPEVQFTATKMIAPGQYMVSIGALLPRETEFRYMDSVDPSEPVPKWNPTN